MAQIDTIKPKAKLKRKTLVAAYARVSSGKDAMLHSLSAQVSYYSELIQANNDWLYVGVYSDEGISGTCESRPGFQRMVDDAKAGKIDLIITKSISRFARNTITLLETVRSLKDLGVAVYFEEQRINTLTSDGELMITLLASFAQEEARSVSENQKWRVKRKFEEGLPWGHAPYGYKYENGRFVIIPEEAKIVKLIYSLYKEGMGFMKIRNYLQEKGVPSKLEAEWSYSTVSQILHQYAYTGNIFLQKTYNENYITKKSIINKGERAMYHSEEAHKAIITIEEFNEVQKMMAEKLQKPRNVNLMDDNPFKGIIECGCCGWNYVSKKNYKKHVWICSKYKRFGKEKCSSRQFTHDELLRMTKEVLDVSEITAGVVKSQIKKIVALEGKKLIFILADGREVEKEWVERSRSESWTQEMREATSKKSFEQARQRKEKVECQK